MTRPTTVRQRLGDDSGAVYVLMVLSIFVLMAMAAFAVDIGWIFLNKSRAQRAADAAALAGVTALPAEPMTAINTAHEFALFNGYDDADPDIVVTPTPTADNELRVQIDDKVNTFFMRVFGIDQVDIDVSAKARYISSVPLGNPDNIFGPEPGTTGQEFTDIGFWPAITYQYDRKADGDPYAARCIDEISTSDPNYADRGKACDGPDINGEYYGSTGGEPDGYYYGIEVPSGLTSLSIQVYDVGYGQGGASSVDDQVFPEESSNIFEPTNEWQRFIISNATGGTYTITIGGETTDPIAVTGVENVDRSALDSALEALPSISGVSYRSETPSPGAYNWRFEITNPDETNFPTATCDGSLLVGAASSCTVEPYIDGGQSGGASTVFRVYEPDDTPFDIRDNAVRCGEVTGTYEGSGSPTNHAWTTVCSKTGSVTPGLYVMRVFNGDGISHNAYSIRANGAGGTPRVFALEDLSIWSTIEGGQTRFFLAEVAEQYRGLSLVVELFDPGDVSSGAGSLSWIGIVGPDDVDTGDPWDATDCTITVSRDPVGSPVYSESVPRYNSPDCALDTTRTSGNDGYQADWVRFTIPIPGNYECPLRDGEKFCWWSVAYNYPPGTKAGERTTWRASVEGSQVALVFEPEP